MRSTNLSADKEEENLQRIVLKRQKSFQEKEIELLEAGEDIENNKDLKDLKNICDVAEKYHEIRKAEVVNNHELVAKLKKDLEKLPGYKTYVVPFRSDTTSSGTEQNRNVPIQRTVKKTVEPLSAKK